MAPTQTETWTLEPEVTLNSTWTLMNETQDNVWQNSTSDNGLLSTNPWSNCTSCTNCTCSDCPCNEVVTNLTEFHIIKAVVLVAVTSVLLISVCRMVLQLFVRYTNVKQDK